MNRTTNRPVLSHPWMLSALSTGLALALVFEAAAAPKQAGGGNEAVQKAQGVIRQLTQEKNALQAEKSAWLQEKSDLENRIQGLETLVARLQPLAGEVERYKSGLAELRNHLEAQLGQERQRYQGLAQRHDDVVTKAKAIQSDNQLLVNAVQERERWIAQCSERNLSLLQANREVLERYRDKGFWQELAEVEPFTGIGSVATENTVEDYQYRLQQLQITPFTAETPDSGAEPAANAVESNDANGAGGQP